MTDSEKASLREEAGDIWRNRTLRGRVRPTTKQRDVLNLAYHVGVLPRDEDHSVAQWVEDNFPEIVG